MRFLIFMALVLSNIHARAAVGCTLNDPDRDVRRIFPEATGYTTEFISMAERGGDDLRNEIEAKLSDTLDDTYETSDVPYAYYNVLVGTNVIGRVHGVNQKGRFGGMQLIVATDLNGVILDFYYQKIASPEARRFRDASFTKLFAGLSLEDFYTWRHRDKGPVADIADPSKKSERDFKATLRGVMKNLILLDVFKLDRAYDKTWKEMRQ